MLYSNPLSRKEFKKVLSYELYESLDDKQKEKQMQISRELESKVRQAKTSYQDRKDIRSYLDNNILSPCFSEWKVFSAIVSSVKHLTQPKGKDDYHLFSYEKDKKILYIAREMFLGLRLELVTEFVFSELLKELIDAGRMPYEDIQKPLIQNNQASNQYSLEIERYTQNLIKNRVVPYSLNGIVEALIDHATEEELSQELSPERRTIHAKNIQSEILKLLRDAPKNARELTRYFTYQKRKKLPITNYQLSEKLGEMGIWNAKMHNLLRDFKINLAEGNTEEICFNSLDFKIIQDCLLTDKRFIDQWIEFEVKDSTKRYERFISELRENLEESQRGYNESKKRGDIQKSQRIRRGLVELRSYFSDLLDPSTHQFVNELDNVIQNMENP